MSKTSASSASSVPQSLSGKTLSDTFMGEAFLSLSPTTRDITLPANTNYLVEESLEIGAAYSLEIPATSTLEISGPSLRNNVVTYAMLLSTIFSGQITTGTNAGAGGGTTNYLNLGGFKICWGTTAASASIASGANGTLAVTFPITFAATPTVLATSTDNTGEIDLVIYLTSTATTGVTINAGNTTSGGGAGTCKAQWIAIGT